MTEALVCSICAEFNVEIISANVFPMPGQPDPLRPRAGSCENTVKAISGSS